MKIVGFGDSFITPNDLHYSYTNLIAAHFNTTFEHYGKEGSGAWNAFFQFKKTDVADVVLFAWSSSVRLYHSEYTTICPAGATLNKNSNDPIWKAAEMYYAYLFEGEKAIYEHTAFYYWLDDWLKETYPNTKFIHMWGFPSAATGSADWGKTENFQYYHRWKNSVEIRPALIHLSYLDEWPKNLSKETRCHHMTPKMHRILADTIIAAIEDYKPGLLNIKL
jgi:hypothetical protein